MNINQLKELLNEFGKNIDFDHDIKKKNWFNIGGKTKVFYKANNLKELLKLLKKLDNKEKIFTLGAGSNTLMTDNLFDGVVKLTGSMRYDKSQYFDGQFTPRLGALVFLSENQNIRFS